MSWLRKYDTLRNETSEKNISIEIGKSSSTEVSKLLKERVITPSTKNLPMQASQQQEKVEQNNSINPKTNNNKVGEPPSRNQLESPWRI